MQKLASETISHDTSNLIKYHNLGLNRTIRTYQKYLYLIFVKKDIFL